MDNEKEDLGLGSSIPEGYKWSDLAGLSGTDLVDKYEEILEELSKDEGLIGTIFTKATNKIDRPIMLKKVIDMVRNRLSKFSSSLLAAPIRSGYIPSTGAMRVELHSSITGTAVNMNDV